MKKKKEKRKTVSFRRKSLVKVLLTEIDEIKVSLFSNIKQCISRKQGNCPTITKNNFYSFTI